MTPTFPSRAEIIRHYKVNIAALQTAVEKRKKTKRALAIGRLSAVFMGLFIAWYFPVSVPFFLGIIFFMVAFIWFVFRDSDQSTAIKNEERLIEINQHEIDAMEQNLTGYDDGQIYADAGHAYASDLDLFGPASLFQWLSRCHAEQSKKLLAEHLKSPLDQAKIVEKQSAARELAKKQPFCQQFQSNAMANPLSFRTEARLRKWMDLPAGTFSKPYWQWLLWIYPLITLGTLVLFMVDFLSPGYFIFFCIGFLAFAFYFSSRINPVYELLSLIQPEMESLHGQLSQIENENFVSRFLLDLQQRLKPDGFNSSSDAIRVFHLILKRFEFRLNLVVFIILNSFFLWDLRQLVALNEWKAKNRSQLHEGFEVIAEMEFCISLASLTNNEPAWVFPEVDGSYFHFQGEALGHPLIHAADRVVNDFTMEGVGRIAIITGSNMAGKSTFLRSLGINSVLALMGAPVCAARLRLSAMKLITSMRVADNLAENTSTFYAELKKLKYIIDSVNMKEQSFILLDEVLRGTNSTDRHKGSRALIRQLLQLRAVAVMATHDTELAHAEAAAHQSVSNYYFEGKIQEDDLYFDYKIKQGICESLNATTLMKKIGIHFQD